MKTKNDIVKAAWNLYQINSQIKDLTEQAEAIKRNLRNVMPDVLELQDGVVCKKQSSLTPVFDNKKLYAVMTPDQIVAATKPVVGELKKIYGDDYEDFVDGLITEYKQTICIKFTEPK